MPPRAASQYDSCSEPDPAMYEPCKRRRGQPCLVSISRCAGRHRDGGPARDGVAGIRVRDPDARRRLGPRRPAQLQVIRPQRCARASQQVLVPADILAVRISLRGIEQRLCALLRQPRHHLCRCRAHTLIMMRACAGVLNGIDMAEWNPEADAKIYQNYSASKLKEGKTANKLALQKELTLQERPEVSVRSPMCMRWSAVAPERSRECLPLAR